MESFENFKFADMMENTVRELSENPDYCNAAIAALNKDGSVFTACGGESDIVSDPYTAMYLGMHIMADAMLQIVFNNAKNIVTEAENTETE